jgi:hypothetical protein
MHKIMAFWNSLPHAAQAVIVFFFGNVLGCLAKYVTAPEACLSLYCWREYMAQSLTAGIVAVFGLYTKSSLYLYQH